MRLPFSLAEDNAGSSSAAPEALSPVAANQSLTINALLGYINAEPVFASDVFRPLDERFSFRRNAPDAPRMPVAPLVPQ